jgi:RNA polymerase sigma factor (sigma-70 family)
MKIESPLPGARSSRLNSSSISPCAVCSVLRAGHRRRWRLNGLARPIRSLWNSTRLADMKVVVAASDRELWERAVAGDAHGFGSLFERHGRAVYNFAFRRTANWGTAEDVASEVFLVAWRRRADVVFSGESDSVLPWLLGVATNHLRNVRRGEARAGAALARLDAGALQPDFSDEIVGRLGDEAQMAKVLRVLDELPEQERDVLALCAWSGLDYVEAAVALAVPIGTVRSRLSRARAHLRELLDANGHELDRDAVTR